MKYNPIIKKDIKKNAELKTFSDYALILEHCNGYTRESAVKSAAVSHGEPLFDELLERNIELFSTGSIILQ